MRKHGSNTELILSLLKEQGPMTRSELDQAMGNVCYKVIAATLTHLKKKKPKNGRQIYISSYVYDDEVRRYYPRAVYSLGDKPDAKKPISDPMAIKRRYLAKVKGKYKLNNVFNLGLTRDAIKELRKAA
jgi:hypothetical protein